MSADPAILTTVAFVFLALAIAGSVKGAMGLGLPPIAMAILVLTMPPAEAAAMVVLPSLFSNAWLAVAGPDRAMLIGRLWPFLLLTALFTLIGAPLMDPAIARTGTIVLGAVLTLYAATALFLPQPTLSPTAARRLGPPAGVLTGLATAATGISAVPAIPYLQALGLGRDAMVQGLGMVFAASALALTVNLIRLDALTLDAGPAVLAGLAGVAVGLAAGQSLRHRLNAALFRRILLGMLLAIGVYTVVRAGLFW